jgi:hypothetical protein
MMLKNILSKAKNVEDLPTCISDIEPLIPEIDRIITDIRAGNYE